jgi:hypothetical protein
MERGRTSSRTWRRNTSIRVRASVRLSGTCVGSEAAVTYVCYLACGYIYAAAMPHYRRYIVHTYWN